MRASEVLRILRVSRATLSKYVKEGRIRLNTSVTKWNDYNDSDVYSMINKSERKTFVYARVSTSKQEKDLENQIELLKTYSASKGYRISGIYSDIASGISLDKRKDLLLMIDSIINNEVERVVITYKDRLSRVGFDLFKKLFLSFGCTIEVMNDTFDSKTDEKARDILSTCGLEDLATRHPYDLSGGEQQRIALARAILKNAPIVVLDEATAFADPENEYQIQKAFEVLTRNKTVLMIAHRLSTVQNADSIIVLSGGKIIEQGSHESLLSLHGVYTSMWKDYQRSAQWKVGKEESV